MITQTHTHRHKTQKTDLKFSRPCIETWDFENYTLFDEFQQEMWQIQWTWRKVSKIRARTIQQENFELDTIRESKNQKIGSNQIEIDDNSRSTWSN